LLWGRIRSRICRWKNARDLAYLFLALCICAALRALMHTLEDSCKLSGFWQIVWRHILFFL
jgi:hypothetical protein